MEPFVHETSIIDKNVKIGAGTKIWQWVHVSEGAIIGENCVLGQGVFIGKNVMIGNGVKIQNNVSVFEGVVLEDNVFCGPSCVFTNVINPRASVSRKDEYRITLVRQGATIGANATIICGNTIGEYAFIGAGSLVTRDIKAYRLAYGNPAQHKDYICECGTQLTSTVRKIPGGEPVEFKCEGCYREYHNQEGTVVRKK